MRSSPPAVYSGPDTLIFDGREKTFYVIDLCCAGSWPGVAPGMIAPVRRTAGERAAPEAFASGETGGERLIVCARRAKKHAGRARHVMRAFFA
jgi:hypothetical protein